MGTFQIPCTASYLYIVNPVKTDGGVLVGGVNVMPDAELAYEQMCETKQTFGKELGRRKQGSCLHTAE
jgi:hypothetical protein